MPKPARAILVIDVSAFAESLLLLPAARALRRAYPQAFLAVAASKGATELLAASGSINEAIDLGVIKTTGTGAGSGFGRLGRLISRTRHGGYDVVIDLSPRIETQILSRAFLRARTITPSRLPHIIDALFGRGDLPRGAHDASLTDALKQLGVEFSDKRLALALPAEANAAFEQLLHRHGSRGGEPIVLLYSSSAPGPRGWAADHFGALAGRLANSFGARVVVTDEPADSAFTKSVAGLLPQTAIRMAEPSAVELAAAVARASIVVTDEPGLARLAVDLGTPVLEISGEPAGQPLSRLHRIVHGSTCAGVTCEQVYDVACGMLQESRSESLFRN